MRRRACIALALLVAAPAAAQVPEGAETFEYVVVAGESCPSIAERVYGDRRRYDIVHAYNTDLGPLPHRLAPGQRLTLPIVHVRQDGPDAEVTAMQPQVRGRPSEQRDWRSLRLGTDLSRGWRVNTRERAFAELTFRDETQIALRENTVVVVFGASAADTRRSASEARLDRGSLRARLAELRGRSVRVTTPSARADLEGGSAVVSVDEGETSRVSNHEGRPARVSTPDGRGSVTVRPGMGSQVDRGQRPSPPRPLPAAPTWVAGPARFVGVHRRTSVRGEWTAVPDARVYRVEIARGVGGAGLMAAVEVPSDVTRFEVHGLPPGAYHARVSTIGRDFFESAPSASYAFEVVLARLRGPEEPADAEPVFDPGDPAEEVRALDVEPGSVFEAPDGYACALGGEPASRFVLEPEREGTVACTDPDGAPAGGVALAVGAAAPEPAPVEPAPPPPPAEPPPPRPPPPLLHESLGAALLASAVGVRDLDRRGVSVSATLSWFGAHDGAGDRLRASVGAVGDVLDDHLRLGAAAAFDLYGQHARTADRGSGDVWLSAAYLPRLDDVALLFELGAFLPAQQGPSGIGAVRLAPTAEGSLRVAEERVALRTRQSALIDLSDAGNAMWASAYAVDAWIVGPWSAGAELALTLGQEDADLRAALALGVMTWVDLGPVSLELAGRFDLVDASVASPGPAAILVSIRGGNQPWRPEVGW